MRGNGPTDREFDEQLRRLAEVDPVDRELQFGHPKVAAIEGLTIRRRDLTGLIEAWNRALCARWQRRRGGPPATRLRGWG
jgi:hypothetical protein